MAGQSAPLEYTITTARCLEVAACDLSRCGPTCRAALVEVHSGERTKPAKGATLAGTPLRWRAASAPPFLSLPGSTRQSRLATASSVLCRLNVHRAVGFPGSPGHARR